ncbi:lysozyme inhibitor LprI family protein [Erythrobacter sp. SDW2]|uniref:lysozyme inhibitor LprI family protein n=1 Tax=Erythrobacter sp. SDW2 TaxID=2907154 RepID=UPI001F24D0BC|nr:lysozyme inhibitor LprI family protein [Erythrobacter sp. SDW2]UIP06839.1 lysozyme inhibitor LprI family protein [Erythrobacter sp. SDW2]
MPDWIQQAILALAAGVIGWFARRWLTRERTKEEIEILSGTAKLVEALNASGLSMEEARSISRDLSKFGNVPSKATIEAVSIGIEDAIEEYPNSETSFRIAQSMANRLTVLDAELASAIFEVECAIPSRWLEMFREAQTAWEAWREAERHYSGFQYVGGSIMIIEELSTAIAMTESRTNALREFLAGFRTS